MSTDELTLLHEENKRLKSQIDEKDDTIAEYEEKNQSMKHQIDELTEIL